MRDYVYPKMGQMRVDGITTADVMAVLSPIWNTKPPTARRVRQRITTVMKWAIAQGYRMDNPAGEALGAALPKQGGIQRHFKALPYGEVAGAIQTVQQSRAGVAVKLGFEFLVLTACRSGEMRGARWEEIDLEAGEWRIPPERMKHKREHRVPLSGRAREILAEARENTTNSEWVFPSPDLPAFFGPPITGEQRQSAWLSRSRVLLGQREPASPASAHRHPSQHGAAL